MNLGLKEFNIEISKLDKRLASIASSNYDGLVKDETGFIVVWKEEPSSQDIDGIQTYWDNLNQTIYNTPTALEQGEYLAKLIENAKTFGNTLTAQFALENVALGITQAGKTRAVADYCQKLQYYLSTGSLYAALEEIQDKSVDIPSELSPYVTTARLTTYLHYIQDYLQIPRT